MTERKVKTLTVRPKAGSQLEQWLNHQSNKTLAIKMAVAAWVQSHGDGDVEDIMVQAATLAPTDGVVGESAPVKKGQSSEVADETEREPVQKTSASEAPKVTRPSGIKPSDLLSQL